MKVSGNSLRPGHVISHQGQMWVVSKAQHTQPGKGGAYMCVVLRNIKTGTKKDERFRAAEDVERLFIEESEHDFLYQEGDSYVFMNPETYEQVTVSEDIFDVSKAYLQPNMRVRICFHETTPISVSFPAQVILEIVEADPAIKGQTASSSYKNAVLNNGIKTMVPPHLETGDKIVVKTEDDSYVERYKGP